MSDTETETETEAKPDTRLPNNPRDPKVRASRMRILRDDLREARRHIKNWEGSEHALQGLVARIRREISPYWTTFDEGILIPVMVRALESCTKFLIHEPDAVRGAIDWATAELGWLAEQLEREPQS